MSAFSNIGFLIVHQLIISTTTASAAEGVFTAMADIESLVPTVYHVANLLNEYIKAEESKLQRLRWLFHPHYFYVFQLHHHMHLTITLNFWFVYA